MDIKDLKDILEFVGMVAGKEWHFRLIENPREVDGCLVDIRYSDGSDLDYGAAVKIDSGTLEQSVIPIHQTIGRLRNVAEMAKHRAMMSRMSNHD